MINKIVVHYSDGIIIKGETGDFAPNKNFFHLNKFGSGEIQKIDVSNLKAIFFVQSLDGDSTFNEKDDVDRSGLGRKVQVEFNDGETQLGYTQGYAPNRPGFFVTPCDPESNNLRIFVVTAATKNVQFV